MRPLTRLLLFAAWSLLGGGLLHAGVIDKSYRDARALLDAGLKAQGGADALRAVTDVRRVGTATL